MGKQMIPLMHRRAPLWLLQMPKLLEPGARVRLQHSLPGVSREHMLREMVAFIDAVTVERSLILVLKDLHWSDTSTLSLISFLARHHEAARLLIIATYRPTEVRSLNLPGDLGSETMYDRSPLQSRNRTTVVKFMFLYS
jgi:predicted ATPase